VRDAAANILENTTLADLIADPGPRATKGKRAKKKEKGSVLPMVVGGQKGE
jgi:DNA-binding IscR family transcriptional regulator